MLGTKKRPDVFSIATTAALITAAIAGIGTTLLVVRVVGSDALPIAYPIGATAFVVLMFSFFRYERFRYREVAD
jgi:energy-converting hydrogenase Eha subunit A